MPVTLAVRWLLAQRRLGLEVRAGATALDNHIRWAHSIELADPTQWLEGGELVLTTGLGLPRSAAEQRRYVKRLHSAGIAALGFGVGLSVRHVPRELVEAADDVGLPLLEVPLPTPFIAVTKVVLDRLAELQYQNAVRVADIQPRMTRAAVRGGAAAVVKELATATHAEVAFFDPDNRLVAAHPHNAAEHLGAAYGEAVEDLPATTSAVTINPSDVVATQRVAAGRRLHGTVTLRHTHPLSHVDQLLLGHAVSLIALEQELPRRLKHERQRVHSTLMSLIFQGILDADTAQRHLTDAGVMTSSGTHAIVVAGAPPPRVLAAATAIHFDGGPLILGGEHCGRAVLLVGCSGCSGHEDTDRLADQLKERLDRSLHCGHAAAPTAADLPNVVHHAHTAAQVARSRDTCIVGFADLVGRALLATPETNAVLTELAATRLRPLADHDARRRTNLVTTLRTFLEHNGQWEPAAHTLGVHRHTLRNRIARISTLLDVDLGDAHVRAELLMSLLAWTPSHADGPSS